MLARQIQGKNAISRSQQEITPTVSVQQPGTQAVHTGSAHTCDTTTVDIFMQVRTHTSQHTGSQHQCPNHREFVLSWFGRQDESMRGQLTGHAYSSAKEKRERKGARDSERNQLSPGATCLTICITLQILQRAFSVYGMRAEEVEKKKKGKKKRKLEGSNYFIRLTFVKSAVNSHHANACSCIIA